MKKILLFLAMSAGIATPILAQAQTAPANTANVEVGKPLVDVDGKRIGAVYRVGEDGAAQVIIDGKMYSVPAATLSMVDDKLVTSLKKKEVLAKR